MRSAQWQRTGWLKSTLRFCNLFFICILPVLLGFLAVGLYSLLHKGPSGLESLWALLPQSATIAVTDVLHQLISVIDEPLREFVRLVRFNADYKEQYYSALATLFAVIVGLALLKGIEGGDDARQAFAAEADTVRSILGYLEYFESHEVSPATHAAITQLRVRLRDYASAVAARDSQRDAATVTRDLSACRTHILDINPADRDDQIAQGRVIELYELLLTLRARRLSMDARSVPFYLRAALVLMALALIAPFLAEPLCVDGKTALKQYGLSDVPNPESLASAGYELKHCPSIENSELYLSPTRFSQYYMIFSLTAFFMFLLQLLQDVSTTHKGFWEVRPRAFEQLVKEIDKPSS